MIRKHALSILLILGSLTACSANSDEALSRWMADQKSKSRPKISAIAEPKKFQPESYEPTAAADPFSMQKLTQVLNPNVGSDTAQSKLIAFELKRSKEPLEAYPLDAIAMVGSMAKNGKPLALVKVDKLLYQVHMGTHLGLNYGRVTALSEREITLREIVQDALGHWTERVVTMQLQERLK
jgi:type IV pilus assembly protein PilP